MKLGDTCASGYRSDGRETRRQRDVLLWSRVEHDVEGMLSLVLRRYGRHLAELRHGRDDCTVTPGQARRVVEVDAVCARDRHAIVLAERCRVGPGNCTCTDA